MSERCGIREAPGDRAATHIPGTRSLQRGEGQAGQAVQGTLVRIDFEDQGIRSMIDMLSGGRSPA